MVLPAAAVDGVHLPAECHPVAAATAVRPVADGNLPVVLLAGYRPVAVGTVVRLAADGHLPVVLPAECRPVVAVTAVPPVAVVTAVRPVADGSRPVVPPASGSGLGTLPPRRRGASLLLELACLVIVICGLSVGKDILIPISLAVLLSFLLAPLATRRPPTTATSTYCTLPMNIVMGCIRLDMNCAPNDDRYSSSFVTAKRSSTSRWRPARSTCCSGRRSPGRPRCCG